MSGPVLVVVIVVLIAVLPAAVLVVLLLTDPTHKTSWLEKRAKATAADPAA